MADLNFPSMFDTRQAMDRQVTDDAYKAGNLPLGGGMMYAASLEGDLYGQAMQNLGGMLGGKPDPRVAKQQALDDIMQRFPDPRTPEQYMEVASALRSAGLHDYAAQTVTLANEIRSSMPKPSKPSTLQEKVALFNQWTKGGKELTKNQLDLLGITPADAPVFKQRIKELENELSSGKITQKVFDEKKLELIMGGDKNKGQTNYHIGSIPQDFIVATDENGQITMKVVPGSPTDIANMKNKEAKGEGAARQAVQSSVVIEDIVRLTDAIKNDSFLDPASSSILSYILENPIIGSGKNRIDAVSLATTIKSSIGFDRLQQMREESPTGGALGQVSELELVTLQATLGSLDLNQSKENILHNLERLEEIYVQIFTKLQAYPNFEKYFGKSVVSDGTKEIVEDNDPLKIRQ